MSAIDRLLFGKAGKHRRRIRRSRTSRRTREGFRAARRRFVTQSVHPALEARIKRHQTGRPPVRHTGSFVWKAEAVSAPASHEDALLTQPTIDRTSFREAMSRVPAQVHLVTTDGPAGRRGVTVTSVCSVSDSPATLLVCLNLSSPLNARFAENGVFAVSPLGSRDEPVARVFAGEGKLDTEGRFASAEWSSLATGAPILRDALVAFDCRLVESRVVATHRIMIGEVVAVHMGESDSALLYRDRRYLSL